MGECKYDRGRCVGKHWKKHPDGTMSYLATYDKKGHLKQPIRNFDENGQKIAEFSTNFSLSITLIVAFAAAQAKGLPPNVVPWPPFAIDLKFSSVDMQAPIGKPPAIPFATHITSGVMP